MNKILVIGFGGFIGAVARYYASGLPYRWLGPSFPYGTLLVNVLGCLVIGALMSLGEERNVFSPELRLFVFIGILGAFTTFSTFGYETLKLLQDAQFGYALWNVGGNVLLCLAAVWGGWTAVRAILS